MDSRQDDNSVTLAAWARLQDGADADAFAEVFRAHHEAVYNYAFRRLGDWTQAEDVTQVVFTGLWRRAGQRRVDAPRSGSVRAVLLAMTRQECLSASRSARRKAQLDRRLRANPALHTSGGGGGVSPPPMRSMRSR